MLPRPSHYEILGIPENADKSAVVKAYRKCALVLHPDSRQRVFSTLFAMLEPEFMPYIDEALLRVNSAYQTLTDQVERQQYNSNLSAMTQDAETMEEKARNDTFCQYWKKFKEIYEEQMAFTEVMRNPDYLTTLLKDNKKLKGELKALEDVYIQLDSKFQELRKTSQNRENALQDQIIGLSQQVANEKRLRETAEQEKRVLAEKLKTQTSMPSSSSFNASPYSMFNANAPIKGLGSIRKDYFKSYNGSSEFTFSGLNLVFGNYEDANYFYLSLKEKTEKKKFEIGIPCENSEYLFRSKSEIYTVRLSINFDYSLSNYRYALSEKEKHEMLLTHLKQHFNISGVSIIDWDGNKNALLQRETISKKIESDTIKYYDKKLGKW